MLKPIIACLAFLICVAAGAVRSEELKAKLRTQCLLIADLNSLGTLLRYERRDVKTLIGGLAQNGALKAFWGSFADSIDKNGASAAFERSKKLLMLTNEQLDALRDFLTPFGTGDIETELTRLALTIEKLERISAANEKEMQNRLRLAGTLSILLGAALALVII